MTSSRGLLGELWPPGWCDAVSVSVGVHTGTQDGRRAERQHSTPPRLCLTLPLAAPLPPPLHDSIRAMAMDSSGTLVGDFVFDAGTGSAKGRLLHVRNAPSPAATSSLAIAEAVVERATDEFALQELNRSRSK